MLATDDIEASLASQDDRRGRKQRRQYSSTSSFSRSDVSSAISEDGDDSDGGSSSAGSAHSHTTGAYCLPPCSPDTASTSLQMSPCSGSILLNPLRSDSAAQKGNRKRVSSAVSQLSSSVGSVFSPTWSAAAASHPPPPRSSSANNSGNALRLQTSRTSDNGSTTSQQAETAPVQSSSSAASSSAAPPPSQDGGAEPSRVNERPPARRKTSVVMTHISSPPPPHFQTLHEDDSDDEGFKCADEQERGRPQERLADQKRQWAQGQEYAESSALSDTSAASIDGRRGSGGSADRPRRSLEQERERQPSTTSSGNGSGGIKFAPLPPGKTKGGRSNSITIGVATRAKLLGAQQANSSGEAETAGDPRYAGPRYWYQQGGQMPDSVYTWRDGARAINKVWSKVGRRRSSAAKAGAEADAAKPAGDETPRAAAGEVPADEAAMHTPESRPADAKGKGKAREGSLVVNTEAWPEGSADEDDGRASSFSHMPRSPAPPSFMRARTMAYGDRRASEGEEMRPHATKDAVHKVENEHIEHAGSDDDEDGFIEGAGTSGAAAATPVAGTSGTADEPRSEGQQGEHLPMGEVSSSARKGKQKEVHGVGDTGVPNAL